MPATRSPKTPTSKTSKPWTKRRVARVRKAINMAFGEARTAMGRYDADEGDEARRIIDRERAEAMALLDAFRDTLPV